MNHFPPDVHLTIYGPGRWPEPHPFGAHGYLFTIPGDYPDDVPAHLPMEMAVHLVGDDWKVHDVNGDRRVWATAGSRREAIGLAFLEVARHLRSQAADVAAKRQAAGLQLTPPYMVETTHTVTLVLAPGAIGVLSRIETGAGGTPVGYRVYDVDGGAPYVIRQDGTVTLRTTIAGVLHHSCGHTPEDAARFETESAALIYAKHALDAYWPCDQVPQP